MPHPNVHSNKPVGVALEPDAAIESSRLDTALGSAIPTGVAACLLIIGIGLATGVWRLVALSAPGVVGFLAAYFLMRRGAVLWSAYAIALTATALVTASAVTGAGLRDPGVLAYPVIVIFAGMTLSNRMFFSSLAIVAASMVSLIARPTLGPWIPAPAANNPEWANALIAAVIMAATTYAVWALADSARQALARARHEVQQRRAVELDLEELLTHDFLTGVFNRRFFDAELARLDKSRRGPVSIIVADIDGLKDINDRLGHWAGDDVIVRAARILASCVRAEDILARMGGDEFSILLPATDSSAADEAVGRIETALRESWASEALNVQLSLGAATSASGALEEVHAVADARMYAAKSKRRAALESAAPKRRASTIDPSTAT